MIPLKDNLTLKRFPYITLSLIFLNILVFLYELSLGSEIMPFIERFAIVPVQFFSGCYKDNLGNSNPASIFQMIIPLVSSMFLHSSFMHIAGNMLYLWIFGDNVEDRLGHVKFLMLYFGSGLLAASAHLIMNCDSAIPSLGASGAVAGVLGAYVLLYPKAKILTILPVFLLLQFFELPAFFFIGLWILQQVVHGAVFYLQEGAESGGVAWWAHIGGFMAGFALVMLLRPLVLRRKKVKVAAWEPLEGRFVYPLLMDPVKPVDLELEETDKVQPMPIDSPNIIPPPSDRIDNVNLGKIAI